MKNKISVLFFLLIVINGYAQQPNKGNKNEPIIIYDTISVYDTLVVYDTVKVNDKTSFQNANTIENALLTIDTASKKTSVKLFFENDTATIPINSILLSENTKNVDTMKKEILTLVAAGLLIKASVSQTIIDSTTTTNPPETITIAQNSQSVKNVVLKNKISGKEYTISLPCIYGIRLKNTQLVKPDSLRKIGSSYLFRPIIASPVPPIITNIDSSFIMIKYHPRMQRSEARIYEKAVREINKNPTLSKKEKEDKYFLLTYSDSLQIPIESIKSIRFSKFNCINKRFSPSLFNRGFNENNKHWHARAFIYTPAMYIPALVFLSNPVSFPFYLLIAGGVYSIANIAEYQLTKKIELEKWETVPQ